MKTRAVDRGGQFIVFEGVDGVGKTTLARRLVQTLRGEGVPCDAASFPGRGPGTLAAHIYRLYHKPSRFGVRAVDPSALQMLLTAAHIETIRSRILPSLQAGRTVVLDRFWWSTLVYGRATAVPEPVLSGLLALEDVAWSGVVPTKVFLVTRSRPQRLIQSRRGTTLATLAVLYRKLARSEAARGVYPVSVLLNDGPIHATVRTVLSRLNRR
jgi:thymidylate kinase